MMVKEKETNIWAILGFAFSFFCQILGIIFSIIGLSQIKEVPNKYKGEGLAMAGLIISIVMIAVGILIVLLVFNFIGLAFLKLFSQHLV